MGIFSIKGQVCGMRIKGPNGTGGIYSGRAGVASKGSGTFSLPQASQPKAAEASRAPVGISSVDALIAIQATDDREGRRKRAMKRGHSLLDQLDDLKVAILSGRINGEKLQKLIYTLSQRVELEDSPELRQIMEDIELRAQVELAKLGHSQV